MLILASSLAGRRFFFFSEDQGKGPSSLTGADTRYRKSVRGELSATTQTKLKKKDRYKHPLYKFTFKTVSLKKSDFKRGKTVDPVIFEEDGRLISV